MYCIRCGTENKDNSNYCTHCGNKLEVNNNIQVNKVDSVNREQMGSTNLSIASLVCLILKFVSLFGGLLSSSKWIMEVPWLLASLILAIISRVKYKDKMSKVLLIVDIILMVLEVILFIILIIIIVFFISNIIDKWGETDFINRFKQVA